MGLDTTHGAWNGAYSSFMTWRRNICRLAGLGNLDAHEGFGGSIAWDENHPLTPLLFHSDCDGELTPIECKRIADALTELLPLMDGENLGGHIGNLRDKTQTFINGCMEAFNNNEQLEFH